MLIGALTGFTNIGDMHSQALEGEKVENVVADHMLVFMVRGLFSSLQFPYAQFPCTDLCGDHMFAPFWEAVGRLEQCGFRVMALVCDGLSANRRLFRLHSPKARAGDVYKVANPYCDDRQIYFISDPPHLIKTVRNAWSNEKRKLWVSLVVLLTNWSFIHHFPQQCKGKEITWGHLNNLYKGNRSKTGVVLIPKLKYEHLHLTNFSKMRVDLAAQVNVYVYCYC